MAETNQMNQMNLLEVNGLYAAYGRREVLSGLSLTIRRAEVDEHTLDMPDMQIPVGFGRETGLNRFNFSAFDIVVDNLFDKVGCFNGFDNLFLSFLLLRQADDRAVAE